MLEKKTVKELSKVFKDKISFTKEDLLCYSYDAMGNLPDTMTLPDAVFFPQNATDISHLLKLANIHSFPVIPRGAGSGFTGGSLPVEGGVIVSLERMNRILEIDKINMTVTVEPGVVNGTLQDKLSEVGLFYPPDPASLKFSTIGGNIAECAGGPRAVKYGVTRDYVLGLEAVLPAGEVVFTGVKTRKGVVGYDLTRLIVGSEGTIAIVTKAVLRIIKKPQSRRTMLVSFPKLIDGANAVSSIIASDVTPSMLEIMDKISVDSVRQYAGGVCGDLPVAEAMLLIEVDGREDALDREIETIKEICTSHKSDLFKVAQTEEEAGDLIKTRRSISPSLSNLNPNKLNEDIVVPVSRIPELIEGVHDIGKKHDVVVAAFGHGGDGNIHCNVMYNKTDESETDRAFAAVEEIFKLTVELGGTISGEHGVGIAKADYVTMELSDDLINVMKAIKNALDPNGILNPGKIFGRGKG